MSDAAQDQVLFDALLTPHRSLSPRGFAILMAIAGCIGFVFGGAFILLGAWPIFGFCGAEWLLFYFCFRHNFRADRVSERIRLTPDRLTVERRDRRGRLQSWSFQPYWLRVELEEHEDSSSALALASHGRRLPIASFLSPAERFDLAQALRSALARMKGLPAAS